MASHFNIIILSCHRLNYEVSLLVFANLAFCRYSRIFDPPVIIVNLAELITFTEIQLNGLSFKGKFNCFSSHITY